MNVYTIRDTKAQHSGELVQFRTDAEALRAFQVLANDKQTKVGQYPTDFCLYYLGEWDPEHQLLTADIPKNLATASDFALVEKESER